MYRHLSFAFVQFSSPKSVRDMLTMNHAFRQFFPTEADATTALSWMQQPVVNVSHDGSTLLLEHKPVEWGTRAVVAVETKFPMAIEVAMDEESQRLYGV